MTDISREIAFLRSLWMCPEERWNHARLVDREYRLKMLRGEPVEEWGGDVIDCESCEGNGRLHGTSTNEVCDWCQGSGMMHPSDADDVYDVYEHAQTIWDVL